MKRNLFLKIFFSYLLIVCLSFLFLNFFIKNEIQKLMTGKIEEELFSFAELIDLNSPKAMSDQLRQIAGISGSRVTLVDAQGRVFADSEKDVAQMENHLNRPEIQEARLRGKGKSLRFSQSLRVDMLYVAVTIKDKDRIIGYVRLARPLHEIQSLIGKVYQSIFLTIIIVSALSLLIALFLSYRLSEPIRMMERFTERLRRGEPSGNIILHTSDETKKLADNINYLVEELQDKIRLAQEEKSKLMTALTSINEGVLILNNDERIEFASPALADTLSGEYGDVTGKTLMEAFRNVELQKAFQSFKQTRNQVALEITLGVTESVIMKVSLSEVQGYPGEDKVMVVFHNITRLKKLETIRTDFVANVTHEIRTPLTAIIGYLETLQAGALQNPDDASRFIDIMLKQAQRLNRLVEDLMTLSKIELGEVLLRFEDVSLRDVADNIITLLEAKSAAKKIAMENRLSLDLPPIKADRDRINQIFVNVLDNAIKFTPEDGRVTLDGVVKDDFVVVRISDTGVGIPRDEIQRLGERFYRVDKTRSRELGGTGLGLSIVKHLMLAHGGKMEIESQLGKGTQISLFFPIGKP
ncbi:MAG: HAMP domain-containing histidine kinase [Deltaproteobacteria bacterium]|nr:HAMP domain-containing histidine kinase [Deltaproteobacteria bacterium]